MDKNTDKNFSSGKFLAGLSLFCILGIFLSVGFICMRNFVLHSLDIGKNNPASSMDVFVIILNGILISLIIVFGAIIVWMLIARQFFTRSQVEAIVRFGTTSRIDRWLLDKFFPK